MHSSTSSFDFVRPVPDLAWRGITLAVVLITAVATVGWELRVRAWGYFPSVNDTPDLWADQREAVKPGSMVIIGDSRTLFDNDLDTYERTFGVRPIQLGNVGSCAYPILENLANDPSFHGTVIASLIPGLWMAPPPSPPYKASERALNRYRKRTLAQRSGHHLGMWLEERLAFMNDDLKLEEWIYKLPVPPRAAYHPHPQGPPNFQSFARDRQVRMWDACAKPGPLQDRVKFGWPPLFVPPPPPSYIPKEALFAGMAKAMEQRFVDTAAAVKKIQARGGKVVFIRFPMSGQLKELEDKGTPRAGPWTRILKDSGAPGIYFEDYPELASFTCPEWSHLSAPDAVEFTKRLMPHLQQALAHP
jgi:hypothetical protein